MRLSYLLFVPFIYCSNFFSHSSDAPCPKRQRIEIGGFEHTNHQIQFPINDCSSINPESEVFDLNCLEGAHFDWSELKSLDVPIPFENIPNSGNRPLNHYSPQSAGPSKECLIPESIFETEFCPDEFEKILNCNELSLSLNSSQSAGPSKECFIPESIFETEFCPDEFEKILNCNELSLSLNSSQSAGPSKECFIPESIFETEFCPDEFEKILNCSELSLSLNSSQSAGPSKECFFPESIFETEFCPDEFEKILNCSELSLSLNSSQSAGPSKECFIPESIFETEFCPDEFENFLNAFNDDLSEVDIPEPEQSVLVTTELPQSDSTEVNSGLQQNSSSKAVPVQNEMTISYYKNGLPIIKCSHGIFSWFKSDLKCKLFIACSQFRKLLPRTLY